MEQELWEQGSGLPVALPVLPARLLLPPHQEEDGNPLSQQDPEPHSPRAALAALGGPREEMPLHHGWDGTNSAAGIGMAQVLQQGLDYRCWITSGIHISLPWNTLLQLWARTWPRAHFYC